MTFATFLRDSPCEAFRTLYSRVGGDDGPIDLVEARALLRGLGEPSAAHETARQAWKEYGQTKGEPGRALL